jgi:hypothetical protein
VDVDLVVGAGNLEQIGQELEAAGFRVKRFEYSMNALRPGSKLYDQCSLPRFFCRRNQTRGSWHTGSSSHFGKRDPRQSLGVARQTTQIHKAEKR